LHRAARAVRAAAAARPGAGRGAGAAPSPAPADAAPADEAPPPVASALPKAPPPPEPEEIAAVAAAEAAEPEPEAALEETPSGIGLFPPPGTEPLKIGIVVPDDFELPEGYLRHYQVTDDGQELEPILLFHPDYEVLGPDGQPIELPQDGIVPPSLAPPGMPIRMLEDKPPRDEAP
jgi:hypothetical protein